MREPYLTLIPVGIVAIAYFLIGMAVAKYHTRQKEKQNEKIRNHRYVSPDTLLRDYGRLPSTTEDKEDYTR